MTSDAWDGSPPVLHIANDLSLRNLPTASMSQRPAKESEKHLIIQYRGGRLSIIGDPEHEKVGDLLRRIDELNSAGRRVRSFSYVIDEKCKKQEYSFVNSHLYYRNWE